MYVISLVTQKGGSGKTTVATSTAVAAEEKGYKTLILDMDPQGTAENWFQVRESDSPKLARLKSSELSGALKKAEKAGFNLVIIDTPGKDEPGTNAAIKHADLTIIPCRPTPADMKATPATINAVKRLKRTAAFVITQTPPRSYRNREAEQGLSVLGMVAPHRTVMRNDYQDAVGAGLGVTEFDSDGKAAAEIRGLWDWIESKLEKLTNDESKKNVA